MFFKINFFSVLILFTIMNQKALSCQDDEFVKNNREAMELMTKPAEVMSKTPPYPTSNRNCLPFCFKPEHKRASMRRISKSDITIVSGKGRTLNDIYSFLRRKQNHLKNTFKQYASYNKNLSGKMLIEFNILPDGNLSNVNIRHENPKLEMFEKIFKSIVERWYTDKTNSDNVKISIEVELILTPDKSVDIDWQCPRSISIPVIKPDNSHSQLNATKLDSLKSALINSIPDLSSRYQSHYKNDKNISGQLALFVIIKNYGCVKNIVIESSTISSKEFEYYIVNTIHDFYYGNFEELSEGDVNIRLNFDFNIRSCSVLEFYQYDEDEFRRKASKFSNPSN